jgi:NitT/TauT family transport system substrate-binding protein
MLLALVAALLGLAPIGGAAAEAVKIAVGYPRAAEFLPAFVAQDTGLFEKHGLDVTLTAVSVTSIIPQALLSNSFQIAAGTVPNLMLATEGGLDLVAVMGATRMTRGYPTVSLMVRAGTLFTGPEDLRGKKVGVPGLSSNMDLMLRKWLLDRRIDLGQVTFVELSFAQMADVLKSGQVDAVAAIEPTRSRISASGIGVRVADYGADLVEDVLGALWLTTRLWADANPETLDAFRGAYGDALGFIKTDPERAKQIELKYLGFNGPRFPVFSTELKVEDFSFYHDMGRQVGLIMTAPDPAKLIHK